MQHQPSMYPARYLAVKKKRRPTDVYNFNEVIIIFINDSISRDINAACKKIRSTQEKRERSSLGWNKG